MGMDGLKDKTIGKGKELEGKITGDHLKEAEGKAQGARGDLKNAAGDAKHKMQDKAREVRDTIRD